MSKTHMALRVVCLLTIAALLVLGIGIAYGRYSSTLRKTLTFEAEQQDSGRTIEIRSADGWHTDADAATLTFTLTSTAADQRATLRLTATEGFTSDGATVTLTVEDTAYRGTAEAIEEGDPLYEKVGPGTEYRFYTAGEECTWAVDGTTTYTLTVEGSADASLLRLTATEIG